MPQNLAAEVASFIDIMDDAIIVPAAGHHAVLTELLRARDLLAKVAVATNSATPVGPVGRNLRVSAAALHSLDGSATYPIVEGMYHENKRKIAREADLSNERGRKRFTSTSDAFRSLSRAIAQACGREGGERELAALSNIDVKSTIIAASEKHNLPKGCKHVKRQRRGS
eukprot:jgi/Tetstr1/462712/TSEL_007676.t1